MNATKRFQTYELLFPTLAFGGGQLQQSFNVEAAYDFYLFKLAAYIYDATGTGINPNIAPNITCILQDGSSQQNLTNGETSINNIFGTGELPFILPAAHIVIGGAQFNATVYNRHTATAYSVRLAFIGMHVFRAAAGRGAVRPLGT